MSPPFQFDALSDSTLDTMPGDDSRFQLVFKLKEPARRPRAKSIRNTVPSSRSASSISWHEPIDIGTCSSPDPAANARSLLPIAKHRARNAVRFGNESRIKPEILAQADRPFRVGRFRIARQPAPTGGSSDDGVIR
jgi:hypothetical protein